METCYGTGKHLHTADWPLFFDGVFTATPILNAVSLPTGAHRTIVFSAREDDDIVVSVIRIIVTPLHSQGRHSWGDTFEVFPFVTTFIVHNENVELSVNNWLQLIHRCLHSVGLIGEFVGVIVCISSCHVLDVNDIICETGGGVACTFECVNACCSYCCIF
jgi:hypothetical protein